MVVIGMPLEALLSDGGRWHTELGLLVMAVTMTAPMVAWMRDRGHG